MKMTELLPLKVYVFTLIDHKTKSADLVKRCCDGMYGQPISQSLYCRHRKMFMQIAKTQCTCKWHKERGSMVEGKHCD